MLSQTNQVFFEYNNLMNQFEGKNESMQGNIDPVSYNQSSSQDVQLPGNSIETYSKSKLRNKRFMASFCEKFTSLSYSLEAFWNEIFPHFIRGSSSLQPEENQPSFSHLFKSTRNIIRSVSLNNALNICKIKGECFFLLIYDGPQSLMRLDKEMWKKIEERDYPIIPISSESKELRKLDIKIGKGQGGEIFFCYYNKRQQLVMVSKTCIETCKEEIEGWILASEFAVQDYLEEIEDG